MVEGWCVKCRKKMSMTSIVKKTLGNKIQVKGKCSKCGTNMSVFAKK